MTAPFFGYASTKQNANLDTLAGVAAAAASYPILPGEVGVTVVQRAYCDVRRYGAKVDGVTVDDTAWTNAIASAQALGTRVRVPGGRHKLTTTVTDGATSVAFEMDGPTRTIIVWAGANDAWVFNLTQQSTQILGGCTIQGAVDWSFRGIKMWSRTYVENVFVNRPTYGFQIDGHYGNIVIGCESYQASVRGVDLINDANSNMIIMKQVIGVLGVVGAPSAAGSRGISINGEANVFIGNELSGFDTNLYQEAGWNNVVQGFYNENALTYNLYLAAGSLVYQTVGNSQRRYVVPGAILLTPAGRGIAPGIGYQPTKRLPVSGLVAFYPFVEGAGTVLRDYSGNRNNASLVGGATWVTGPYGNAVRCDASGNLVLPAGTIVAGAPWTVALLLNHEAYGVSGNRVLHVSDGTNSIDLLVVGSSTVVTVKRNNVFVGNLNIPFQAAGDDHWLVVSYDGAATLTLRDPAMVGTNGAGQSYALANPFTGAISQVITNSSTANTIVKYGGIAVWNRELSTDEVIDWVNRPANAVPMQTAPFVISQSITPVSVAAQSVSRQTFTVTGLLATDIVTVIPPASSGNVTLVGWRVSATNQIELTFINPTAGALTPTSGIFAIEVTRA